MDATSADVVAAAVAVIFAVIAEAVEAIAGQAAISPLRSLLPLVLMKKIPPSLLRPKGTYR